MAQNKLVELGIDKLCRICLTLTDEKEIKSLFDSESLSKKYEQISITEINESDGLPQVICNNCEVNLNTAYDFQQLCRRSVETLKNYIESSLLDSEQCKQEIKLEEIQTVETYDAESNLEENNIGDVVLEVLEENNEHIETILVTKSDNDNYDKLDIEINKRFNQIVKITQKSIGRRECTLCDFVATNSKGLSLHISHLHKELKDRWCSLCHNEFDDLLEHSKTHSDNRPYICFICGKAFRSHGHLSEHFRSHSKEKPFKCKTCEKGFISARHLRVHERIHAGVKPYSCNICGRSFTQKGTLMGHIRTHTGCKPYECDICSKTYTTSSALTIHKTLSGHGPKSDCIKMEDENVENTEKKLSGEDGLEFVNVLEVCNSEDVDDPTNNSEKPSRKLCSTCGKTFKTYSKLRIHTRIHTGETPYKCMFCDKRFTTRSQMIVHTRTHTGEKPHICEVCGKGFAQSSVLNTHKKLHTGRTEECHVCNQKFCRPAELRLHMRKHTGEKPYLCTECGQSFVQSSHLTEHMKTHSDERPYKCQYCERAFKQSSSLKTHTKIHTGQKPFQCSQCPYSCRQSYALTQHMRIHANDTPQPDKPHKCLICHRSFTTVAMMTSHARTVHNVLV